MKILGKKIDAVNLFIHIIFIVLCVLFLYPFISMLSVSLTTKEELEDFGFRIWPTKPTWEAYSIVFQSFGPIAEALLTSLFICVVGTLTSLFITSTYAYTLSRQNFGARRLISFLLLFPMFFGGGAAASYIINVNWYHLKNNLLILLIPGSIGTMNVIIVRSFFQGLPYGLIESAKLDGASEYTIFFRIMIPLSTPSLGTIAISCFVGKWNEYYAPMMYFDYGSWTTMSLYLQRLMNKMDMAKMQAAGKIPIQILDEVPDSSMAMAVACITVLPMVCVFPYFQKYFVKGLAVGAIKA